MSIAWGIDLGTTRTSIAMVAPNEPHKGWYGTPQVIHLADGPVTPSAILFESDGHYVGAAAKNMGHRAADCVQVFKRQMPHGDWRFSPQSRNDNDFSSEDLSSLLIEHVSQEARRLTGVDARDVVVTVPAYFGEPERRRTRSAAERAGLRVLDIINEPTAAIVAYLFQPGVEPLDESVLVFDLGGGTFDTVVVKVAGDSLRVVAIDGDLLLGGRDFDATLAVNLSDRFEATYPDATLPTADASQKARLLLDIEAARESLSAVSLSNIPVWGGGDSANLSLNVALARTEFDDIVDTLIDQCIAIAKRAMATATKENVVPSRVLFVGGMTRTPRVRQRVLEELGLQELAIGADPDLMVVKGAAIWAQKLVLESKAKDLLGIDSLDKTDWASDELRDVLRKINTETAYHQQTLLRLLRLELRSVTPHGYAHRYYDTQAELPRLKYLIPAGSALPYQSQPHTFRWLQDVDRWELCVYEDSLAGRGTVNPKQARLVEVVTGQMSREWPKDSRFEVVYSMGLDQILHIRAWQVDGEGKADELYVTVDTVGS